MADLAEAAGVSRPILYDHFGDRAGVAAALVKRFSAQLVPDIGSVLATDVPLRDAISRGIDLFCVFVENEPELFRFLFGASGEDASTMGTDLGEMFAASFSASLAAVGGDPLMGETWGHALPRARVHGD